MQNATASQEKLAQAAQSSVSTITRLAEVVKLGAASLGSEDPETQVGWSTCSEWRVLMPCRNGMELRVYGLGWTPCALKRVDWALTLVGHSS